MSLPFIPMGAGPNYGNRVMNLTPLAYYPMNETGGIVCTDVSGNAYHGEYKNGPTLDNVAGPGASMGNAPLFDGINDFVELGTSGIIPAFNAALHTVSIWFRVANAGMWSDATDRPVMFLSAATSTNGAYYFDRSGANNQMYSYTRPEARQTNIAYGPGTGWMHTAYVRDDASNRVQVYKNGASAGSGTASAWSAAITMATLGSNIPAAGYWSGYISAVAIFNQALSTAQVLDLATAV